MIQFLKDTSIKLWFCEACVQNVCPELCLALPELDNGQLQGISNVNLQLEGHDTPERDAHNPMRYADPKCKS